MRFCASLEPLSSPSGAKAAAVQTLRAGGSRPAFAKRLDCGGFSAAFARPPVNGSNESPTPFVKKAPHPRERNAQARRLCHYGNE